MQHAAILVADDDPSLVLTVTRMLEREGYRVSQAHSEAELLVQLDAAPPDLLLLDVRLGPANGAAICRGLRATTRGAQLPIILMSGLADTEEWLDGLRKGASDYLTKPFRTEELLTRVRIHLALAEREQSLTVRTLELSRKSEELGLEVSRRIETEAQLRHSLAEAEEARRALLAALEENEAARAREQLHAERQSFLSELSKRALTATELQSLVEFTASELRRLLKCACVRIFQYAEDGTSLLLRAGIDRDDEDAVGAAFTESTCPPASDSGEVSEPHPSTHHPGLSVLLSGPLRPWGLLDVRCSSPAHKLEDDDRLLADVSTRLSSAIRRHQAEEQSRAANAKYLLLSRVGHEMVRAREPLALLNALAALLSEHLLGASVTRGPEPPVAPSAGRVLATWSEDSGESLTLTVRVPPEVSPLAIDVTVLDDIQEEVRYALARLADERQRRAAELALRQSEELFAAAFQTAVFAVVITRLSDGKLLLVNDAFLDMLKCERGAVLGRSPLELGMWATREEQAAVIQAIKDAGKSYFGTATLLTSEGQPITVEFASKIARIRGEECILSTFHDVSSRVRAERERIVLQQAIEQSSDAVVITDLAGTIQYVNPAFECLSGYSKEEALGANPRILKSGKQPPELYQDLWRTITRGAVWKGQMVNKRKDGTLFTEEVTISPVRDANERIIGFLAVKRDLSPMLSLQAQLFRSQRLEGIGRLAGGIAHDFNNIISVLLSYSSFALASAPSGWTGRDDLMEIKKASQRAAALTQQLLAFSRRQPMTPRPADMNVLLLDMEKMLRRVIGEDISLSLKLASDLWQVEVDTSQVEQVILNLAVNARDAMPKGGTLAFVTRNHLGRLAAETRAAHEAPTEWVVLEVTDSGVGMSPEVLDRIFEPFYTTKEPGHGTGLGLATVYGIIKQSGGTVDVRSAPGEGSTFTLYLPRLRASGKQPSLTAPNLSTEPDSSTVLVVDDDEGIRMILRRIMEGAGMRVLMAADGAQATGLLRENPDIRLVITDVVMPRGSGLDLAKELLEEFPSLPVLLVSGYSEVPIALSPELKHLRDFLPKPFSSDDLLRVAHRLLRARRSSTPSR